MEQGRDTSPSLSVLESLAAVLRLDEDTTAYLVSLGSPAPRRRRRSPRRESVPEGITMLVATLGMPAFVEGRYFDVLAANPLATALSPRLRVDASRLRDVFLNPEEQALYPDWESATKRLVGGFRESVGTDTDDQRFIDLVGELSLASPRFRTCGRGTTCGREKVPRRGWSTPQVGTLHLRREKLVLSGDPGLMLVVYHAAPGSPDAEKLQLLGSFADSSSPAAAARTDRNALRS